MAFLSTRSLIHGAAPHLARIVVPVIVEDGGDAVAVPVAVDEPDPFTGDPSQASGCHPGEADSIDDKDAAVGRLNDLDDVAFRGQISPMVGPVARINHSVCKSALARQQRKSERQRNPQHYILPAQAKDRSDPQDRQALRGPIGFQRALRDGVCPECNIGSGARLLLRPLRGNHAAPSRAS